MEEGRGGWKRNTIDAVDKSRGQLKYYFAVSLRFFCTMESIKLIVYEILTERKD